MHKNSNLLEQEDLKNLEENDLIDKVAFILRSTILKMDKTTLPAVMKMGDLINAIKAHNTGYDRKSLTSNRKMISTLNRLGHCCNYNTPEELETEATISSVNRSQICPPDIIQCPSLITGVAFYNFDRYVDTFTGKDTLHDTVGIIYQNESDDCDIELNSSSISENLDISLPPAKEDGLLTKKFHNYRRLIIDCKC
ncbi:hypothetical protein TNCV_1268031 [Trichonephila clavipes]|nr:hypothetical protein TNCV_1268031 [Trichonephila clavipes]